VWEAAARTADGPGRAKPAAAAAAASVTNSCAVRAFAGRRHCCCASPESCQECGPVSVRSRVLSCPKVSLGIGRPCPIRRPRFPGFGARHTGHVFYGRSNNIRAPGGRRTRPPSSAERARERGRRPDVVLLRLTVVNRRRGDAGRSEGMLIKALVRVLFQCTW
jgi:hypothetical protein